MPANACGTKRSAALLLGLLFLTLACGLSTPSPIPTPAPPDVRPIVSPAPRATQPPYAGTAVALPDDGQPRANLFAPFRYAEPNVSSAQPEELSEEPKFEGAELLDEGQLQALLENRFVVVPGSFTTFADAYRAIAQQELMQFISSDFVLHSFQTVTDVAWQRAQAEYLPDHLAALSAAMVEASRQQWESAETDAVSEAARFNLAFFTVAHRLLEPEAQVAPVVSEIVNEELTLIEQGGTFISPLFQRQEEYARYIAPGHYATSERLSRYYQAMVWLSQPLFLQPQGENVAASRQVARQLLLMAEAVTGSQNLARWERVYQPAAYFGGSDGGWNVTQVMEAGSVVYVDVEPSALDNVARLDNFIATLSSLPAPAPDLLQTPQHFSFMPALTYPDQTIFRQLLFNNVGSYQGSGATLPPSALETSIGTIRGLPRALDVPAVLGSEQAARLLELSGDTNYEGFALQFQETNSHYGALDAQAWTQSAQGAWLYALQPLLTPPPLFLQSEAWQNKQLNTWFGAWVEMRHQTTLGARPIAAAEPPGEATSAYLEPQPLLYGRLAAAAGQMVEGLESRGLLEEEAGQKLLQMERLLQGLEEIALKELSGERLSEDEALLLNQTASRLTNLTTFAAASEGDVPLVDTTLPRLVDIYRDASSGFLTQVAVGEAWPIYVLLLQEEQPVMAAGAVYSSYELIGEQLRADEWPSMEERPEPEAWSEGYLAPQ